LVLTPSAEWLKSCLNPAFVGDLIPRYLPHRDPEGTPKYCDDEIESLITESPPNVLA
jgi:hypothetical protein